MGNIHDSFIKTINCIDPCLRDEISGLFKNLTTINVDYLNKYETYLSKVQLIVEYFIAKSKFDKSLIIPENKIALEDLENLLIIHNIQESQFDLTSIKKSNNYISLTGETINYDEKYVIPFFTESKTNYNLYFNTRCNNEKYHNSLNRIDSIESIFKVFFYVASLTKHCHLNFCNDEILYLSDKMGGLNKQENRFPNLN